MLAVFAAHSQNNRMDVSNLSAVFTPGILSHPDDVIQIILQAASDVAPA